MIDAGPSYARFHQTEESYWYLLFEQLLGEFDGRHCAPGIAEDIYAFPWCFVVCSYCVAFCVRDIFPEFLFRFRLGLAQPPEQQAAGRKLIDDEAAYLFRWTSYLIEAVDVAEVIPEVVLTHVFDYVCPISFPGAVEEYAY